MSIPEKYVGSALAVAITAIVIVALRKKWGSKHPPYPPGPKGYPVIGNVLDFPQNPIWEGFAKMCQEYDTDILHLNIMGSHLVVINTGDVAVDLLERRPVIYADRPRMPMVNELMGCSWSFVLMHYGDAWRINRRLFQRFFNISVVDQLNDKIYKAVNVFLLRLSESPERFLKHVDFFAGSLTLSIAYGVNIESENDKFYATSEEAMRAVETATLPGSFLVDVLPILKHVPEWFPGAGFKKFSSNAKRLLDDLSTLPFQHVKESFQAGNITTSSVVATCLEELPSLAKDGVDEEMIRAVAATVFLGGEETTSSTLKSFLLAATMYPEIVRLAQQELDEVLNGERLPDLSDRPKLPYITAITKEILRWRPPNPLGGPHRLMEDDVYRGWFIPAGTTVISNPWAMFRNESVYPNAHKFDPSRFLKNGQINPDVPDPESLVFGWGKRICPGKHFASRVIFLMIARTLATFDISMCLDEHGNPIAPEEKYTHGVVSHPLPFRSDIKPRSARALSFVVRQESGGGF